MAENRLHQITDCLSEEWLAEWAHAGIEEVETFLGKHAAFESFLESDE